MKGFTLVEILIALAVFAILSSVTAMSMHNAFKTRAIVSSQLDNLLALDSSITRIQGDTGQIVNRAVRDSSFQLKPAFIGQSNFMEFTRGGITNPNSAEKRSTLKRVAYICQKDKLIRRVFASLDTMNDEDYEDMVLIDHLTSCQFQYLSPRNQWHNQWINIISQGPNKATNLPKGVQIQLKLVDWGELSLAFIVSEGLYASIRP